MITKETKFAVIDIETRSVRANAQILQIAATSFSLDNDRMCIYNSLVTDPRSNARVDADTVRFWQDQPMILRDYIFNSPIDRLPLDKALLSLQEFFDRFPADYYIANSPSFDLTILREAASFYDLALPFLDYRKELCLRTLVALYGKEEHKVKALERVTEIQNKSSVKGVFVKHNAEYDTIYETDLAREILKEILG